MDETSELCWWESFDDLRYAMRRRIDEVQEQLHHFTPENPAAAELRADCIALAEKLMARLAAGALTDFDLEHDYPYGQVSATAVDEFANLSLLSNLILPQTHPIYSDSFTIMDSGI